VFYLLIQNVTYISTLRDMDLVSVKAVQEIVYAESNGHVTDR